MINICVYMCRFITAEITVRHFSSHKNCVFGIRKLASKFRADGVPRVVVEIGYRARSRWAPRDATMTEYPASTISPWYKSWVEGEKDRHKRFPSSTPRESDPSDFYANVPVHEHDDLLLLEQDDTCNM